MKTLIAVFAVVCANAVLADDTCLATRRAFFQACENNAQCGCVGDRDCRLADSKEMDCRATPSYYSAAMGDHGYDFDACTILCASDADCTVLHPLARCDDDQGSDSEHTCFLP